MTAPEPPYVAVIFSSQRSDTEREAYDATALEMERLAAAQPGYVGIESARGADGFGITVSYWRTEDDARAWKAVAEHQAAQSSGRARWYTKYDVRIATITREYSFARNATAT